MTVSIYILTSHMYTYGKPVLYLFYKQYTTQALFDN